MTKSYAVLLSLLDFAPDWTEKRLDEQLGGYDDPASAKGEAEVLASLAMDELRSLWRAEEISYVSESPADPETNPRIRRPHRVSYRITIGVVPAGLPEGSAHARYAFEVVKFGD